MDTTCVYVRLLNEGTDVWRPAPARRVDAETVFLMVPEGYDPEDEEWEFTPGALVRVEQRTFQDGDTALVAVSAAQRPKP